MFHSLPEISTQRFAYIPRMARVVQLVSVTVWILDLDFKNSKDASPKETNPKMEWTQDVTRLLEGSPVP